jgi:16S rRNA (guanine527-N7)-methyltransferase
MDILLKYFSDFSPAQVEQFKSLEELYKEWNAKNQRDLKKGY